MYLSLENRAIVNALNAEGKKEEADAIVNEWHSDKAPTYDPVVINQRKINEEVKQLDKITPKDENN